MPRIVRYGGLNLSEDALKIGDMAPKVKMKPAPEAKANAAGEEFGAPFVMGDEGEEQESFEEARPAPAAGHAGPVSGEIIQSAMAEAAKIIEDALHKANAARSEALDGIQQEAEVIRARAAQEGKGEGFALVTDTVQQMAKDLEAAIARFEGQRAGFEVEYEEQLKWLAVEISGKVLAKKVSEDDAEMTEMVAKAVQSVKNEPWVRVEVAEEMVQLIDALSRLYEASPNIEVSPVPLDAGTVHVETQQGVMDVSMRTQLANLKEYFTTG